mmetsp:Transcript_3003/g.7924  ORF Transcript_3003/g.7924 Transcript_3003/m.7924 type:complete len:248 (+) Transcript_3003:2055-2798(+)
MLDHVEEDLVRAFLEEIDKGIHLLLRHSRLSHAEGHDGVGEHALLYAVRRALAGQVVVQLDLDPRAPPPHFLEGAHRAEVRLHLRRHLRGRRRPLHRSVHVLLNRRNGLLQRPVPLLGEGGPSAAQHALEHVVRPAHVQEVVRIFPRNVPLLFHGGALLISLFTQRSDLVQSCFNRRGLLQLRQPFREARVHGGRNEWNLLPHDVRGLPALLSEFGNCESFHKNLIIPLRISLPFPRLFLGRPFPRT